VQSRAPASKQGGKAGDKGGTGKPDMSEKMTKVLKEKHLYFDRVVITCKVDVAHPTDV
jgi:hypothetical protein